MASVLRIVVVLACALACAACESLPKHALSQADVANLTLASVKVVFPPDAQLEWKEAGTLEEKERATPNPQLHSVDRGGFRSYAEHRIATALTTESHRLLSGVLQGTWPARLEIRVRHLLIPTTQERTSQVLAATVATAVIAGPLAAGVAASTVHGIFITCDVALVDATSNTVLASLTGVKASTPSTQFSGESVDSVAAAVIGKVKTWLAEKTAA